MLLDDGNQAAEEFHAPEVPDYLDLSPAAVEAWYGIWNDQIVRHWGVGPATTLVIQYVLLYDEWMSCMRSISRKRFVRGSTAQPKANPLIETARKLRADMSEIEAKLWLDPRAALHAGIERVHGLHALRKLQKTNEEPDDDFDVPNGYVVTVEPGPMAPRNSDGAY